MVRQKVYVLFQIIHIRRNLKLLVDRFLLDVKLISAPRFDREKVVRPPVGRFVEFLEEN